jgi:hypothetical protein
MAHACNPGYPEDRDQDDCVQSHPRQIVLQDPISKNLLHTQKRVLKGQGVDPDFKPQYHKTKENLLILE